MIKYDLICKNGHGFEGWFSNSQDYDAQRSKRLVQCPECGSAKIDKAIMSPAVATARKQKAMLNDIAGKIRKEISENCEDVGDQFAEHARAIHYGEQEERGIYGKATQKEAVELAQEGIAVSPLPDLLTPRAKKKLN